MKWMYYDRWMKFLHESPYFTTTTYVVRMYTRNSLDAGIQDSSTSISIVVKVEQPLLKEKKMVMKVTNIYKHEIVDTRA